MMKVRENWFPFLKSLLLVVGGNILYALAVKLFLLPADLMTGGTTGIALVVNHLTGVSISMFVLVFNVCMLAAGFFMLGKQFALTTVVSTFTYPAALEFFDRMLGDMMLTSDPLLCALFSGLGSGASLGIVIRAGASTGGMDNSASGSEPVFEDPGFSKSLCF